jgi:hypothetical protein
LELLDPVIELFAFFEALTGEPVLTGGRTLSKAIEPLGTITFLELIGSAGACAGVPPITGRATALDANSTTIAMAGPRR